MKHVPVVLIVILLVTACGGGGGGTIQGGPPVTLTSIAITPANPALAPGTTTQLYAVGTYSNNARRYITTSATWSSLTTSIATVSNSAGSKGLVTATTTIGTTIINAVLSGITGSATLTNAPVASISVVPPAPPSIAPTTSLQFTATGTLSDSNNTQQNLTAFATWTSLDLAVANVDRGLTTAISAGTATITATYDGQTGSATFKSSDVVSIALSPLTPSIPNGMTQQFTAIGTLADSAQQDLTSVASWSSSTPGVATINTTGLATTMSQGTATILASFLTVTSTPALLTVTPAVITGITVTPANPSIVLGTTQQFIAIGTFSTGTQLDISSSVTWNSSNTAIATISNTSGTKGLATSKAVGSTTIKATSGSISGSTTLTVTDAVLESIAVSPATASVTIGTSLKYTAMGRFSDGHPQDLTTLVTWSSSNTDIAAFNTGPGFEGWAIASFFNIGTVDISATYLGITSNIASLTVDY